MCVAKIVGSSSRRGSSEIQSRHCTEHRSSPQAFFFDPAFFFIWSFKPPACFEVCLFPFFSLLVLHYQFEECIVELKGSECL